MKIEEYIMECELDINSVKGNFFSIERYIKTIRNANILLIEEYIKDKENIIKYLIEHGADVNKENKNGNTPLIIACINK